MSITVTNNTGKLFVQTNETVNTKVCTVTVGKLPDLKSLFPPVPNNSTIKITQTISVNGRVIHTSTSASMTSSTYLGTNLNTLVENFFTTSGKPILLKDLYSDGASLFSDVINRISYKMIVETTIALAGGSCKTSILGEFSIGQAELLYYPDKPYVNQKVRIDENTIVDIPFFANNVASGGKKLRKRINASGTNAKNATMSVEPTTAVDVVEAFTKPASTTKALKIKDGTTGDREVVGYSSTPINGYSNTATVKKATLTYSAQKGPTATLTKATYAYSTLGMWVSVPKDGYAGTITYKAEANRNFTYGSISYGFTKTAMYSTVTYANTSASATTLSALTYSTASPSTTSGYYNSLIEKLSPTGDINTGNYVFTTTGSTCYAYTVAPSNATRTVTYSGALNYSGSTYSLGKTFNAVYSEPCITLSSAVTQDTNGVYSYPVITYTSVSTAGIGSGVYVPSDLISYNTYYVSHSQVASYYTYYSSYLSGYSTYYVKYYYNGYGYYYTFSTNYASKVSSYYTHNYNYHSGYGTSYAGAYWYYNAQRTAYYITYKAYYKEISSYGIAGYYYVPVSYYYTYVSGYYYVYSRGTTYYTNYTYYISGYYGYYVRYYYENSNAYYTAYYTNYAYKVAGYYTNYSYYYTTHYAYANHKYVLVTYVYNRYTYNRYGLNTAYAYTGLETSRYFNYYIPICDNAIESTAKFGSTVYYYVTKNTEVALLTQTYVPRTSYSYYYSYNAYAKVNHNILAAWYFLGPSYKYTYGYAPRATKIGIAGNVALLNVYSNPTRQDITVRDFTESDGYATGYAAPTIAMNKAGGVSFVYSSYTMYTYTG